MPQTYASLAQQHKQANLLPLPETLRCLRPRTHSSLRKANYPSHSESLGILSSRQPQHIYLLNMTMFPLTYALVHRIPVRDVDDFYSGTTSRVAVGSVWITMLVQYNHEKYQATVILGPRTHHVADLCRILNR